MAAEYCRAVANARGIHVPVGDIRTDLVKRNVNVTWLCQAADAMTDKIAEAWSTAYYSE